MIFKNPLIPAGFLVLCIATPAGAVPIGHHGGILLHCEPPHFFDETPGADVKIARFQDFSLTASDNTDPSTIKAFINNEPITTTIEKDRSGAYAIHGRLPEATGKGRVWLRVSADSVDGCDNFKSWFVNVGN